MSNKIWHKQPDENPDKYAYFEAYLRERKVAEVARQFFGDRDDRGVHAGTSYLSALKKEYRWEVRAQAYDRWVSQQKDNAIGELVKSEIQLIQRQRVKMLKDVHKHVRKVVENLSVESDRDLGKVSTILDIATKMDALWRKMEESNPAAATVDKPFENEIAAANDRLKSMILEKSSKVLTPTAPKSDEIIQ